MATEYREAPSDRTPTKPDTTRICKVNTHSWRRTWCGFFFFLEKWYKWTKKERKKYQYYPKTGSFDLEKCRVVREIVKGPASKQGKRTRRKVTWATDNWRTDTQCTESTKLSQESGGLGREKKQEIPGFRSGVSNSNPNIWRWGGGAPGESCKPPPSHGRTVSPLYFYWRRSDIKTGDNERRRRRWWKTEHF